MFSIGLSVGAAAGAFVAAGSDGFAVGFGVADDADGAFVADGFGVESSSVSLSVP